MHKTDYVSFFLLISTDTNSMFFLLTREHPIHIYKDQEKRDCVIHQHIYIYVNSLMLIVTTADRTFLLSTAEYVSTLHPARLCSAPNARTVGKLLDCEPFFHYLTQHIQMSAILMQKSALEELKSFGKRYLIFILSKAFLCIGKADNWICGVE